MNKQPLALALIGALAVAPAVLADTSTPIAGAATSTEIKGEVVAINADTRLMTVKTADGRFEVMRIPPEVSRIDKIKIGDKVDVTSTEAVLVDLVKGKDAGSMAAIPEKRMERAPGSKPAGTMVDKLTLYGKVLSVNKAKSEVTVQGPNQTVTLQVKDKALLTDLAPGDGVVATYVRVITGKIQ